MTLRPRNHFVTLRIAFGRSLRSRASRYLSFKIFGDFEQRPEASIPLRDAARAPRGDIRGRKSFSQRRWGLGRLRGSPGECQDRVRLAGQAVSGCCVCSFPAPRFRLDFRSRMLRPAWRQTCRRLRGAAAVFVLVAGTRVLQRPTSALRNIQIYGKWLKTREDTRI